MVVPQLGVVGKSIEYYRQTVVDPASVAFVGFNKTPQWLQAQRLPNQVDHANIRH
jgi:hypothetical protein